MHAARANVPEDKVHLVHLDIEVLNKMGTFVRVFAGGLTMFVRQATWEELGLPETSTRKLRYRVPPKYLFDREEVEWFRNAAQRLRDNLDACSTDIEIMRPYRWVDYKAWQRWMEIFQAAQAEWNSQRQRLINEYDRHFTAMVDSFSASAEEAYDALLAAGSELPPRQEFIDRIVSRAIALAPSPQEIKKLLVLEQHVAAIGTPAAIERQQMEADRARHERALAEIEHQLELDRRQEQMLLERLELYRQQMEKAQAPLEQLLDSLCQEVAEASAGVLSTLRAHGALRGRSGERLRNLAQKVHILEDLGYGNLLALVRQAGALTEKGVDVSEDAERQRLGTLQALLQQMQGLAIAATQGRRRIDGSLNLVAQEAPHRTWRSICLACRYVWQSEGSLEPAFCPQCRAGRVASRELEG